MLFFLLYSSVLFTMGSAIAACALIGVALKLGVDNGVGVTFIGVTAGGLAVLSVVVFVWYGRIAQATLGTACARFAQEEGENVLRKAALPREGHEGVV